MNKDSTDPTCVPVLLEELWELLEAHRLAFRQERVYWRVVALVFGMLFTFARRTVTQMLLALGMTDADWSPFYRLFSRDRWEEEGVSRCLFRETLRHSEPGEWYVVGVDATQVPRSSGKMPGTSWLRAVKTAVFRSGIHRAQRFVDGAWLPRVEEGFSRAIPLRFLPAFPRKAVPAVGGSRTEVEAGLEFVRWVRGELDAVGRERQRVLVLGDGAYDAVAFWQGLPGRVVAMVRTARNRVLRELPEEEGRRRGRRRKYGGRAPKPEAWLRVREGWQEVEVKVRGRLIRMVVRVEGPYLRERVPGRPLYLVVVRGSTWWAGKKVRRRKRREPGFYLVSAVEREGEWVLPLPVEELLVWVWQRWELEVAHREMKSGLGVGEMQCWNPRSAVVSVQWAVWVYAVLVLAGYRAWGLLGGPSRRERWWGGGKRWSLGTLWRSYRAALWGMAEFRALWTPMGGNWLEKERWVAGLQNAVLGAARI